MPTGTIETTFLTMLSIWDQTSLPLSSLLSLTVHALFRVTIGSNGRYFLSLSFVHTVYFSLVSWGNNGYGRLGLGDTDDRGDEVGEMGDSLPYIDLGTNFEIVDVVTTALGFCVISSNQQLKCAGHNLYAQLGSGDLDSRGDEPGEMGDDLPFVNLGTDFLVADVSGGYLTNCMCHLQNFSAKTLCVAFHVL